MNPPRLRPLLAPLCLVGSLTTSAGCAALPSQRDAAATYLDLRRIVNAETTAEWLIDDAELAELRPQALRTLCQVDDATLDATRAFVRQRLDVEGGSARAVWEAHGRDLDAATEALALERVALVIDTLRSDRGACPFWLSPRTPVLSVHGDEDRFVLLLESGGRASLLFDDQPAIAGGGSARVLPGWGLSPRVTVAAGLEFGGGGALPVGEGSGEVSAYSLAGAPVLVRIHDIDRFVEAEVAAVALIPLDTGEVFPGVRGSFGAGFSTLRVRGFRPNLVFYVSYERYLDPASPIDQLVGVGSRLSLSWDP